MSTAIIGSQLVAIVFELGYVSEWWKIQEKIASWDVITSVPLVYGFFLMMLIIAVVIYAYQKWQDVSEDRIIR